MRSKFIRRRRNDVPFYCEKNFHWNKKLESHWKSIRSELISLPQFGNFNPIHNEFLLNNDKDWTVFFLMIAGNVIEENASQCPQTMKLIQEVPKIRSAWFSVLSPKMRIPPHEGITTTIFRYHLGIIVPEKEKCNMRVGDEIRYWQEGKGMVFDDTYEHEVWNDRAKARVILLLDFDRPYPKHTGLTMKMAGNVLWYFTKMIVPFVHPYYRKRNDVYLN